MMIFKFQYSDTLERESILQNNQDKTLIEEANLFEGNFLIFTDIPRLDEQVAQLKEDNLILMDVLATMYEDMLAKGTV